MKTELTVIVDELRCYIPQADAYNGKHIHKGWARRIEQIIANHEAQRQAGQEPFATLITTPVGTHTWVAKDAAEVAHFQLPGQGHTITPVFAAPQPAGAEVLALMAKHKAQDAEIAALKEQLASLARGVKISTPTDTMEHEFHQHFKRGAASRDKEIAALKADLSGAMYATNKNGEAATKAFAEIAALRQAVIVQPMPEHMAKSIFDGIATNPKAGQFDAFNWFTAGVASAEQRQKVYLDAAIAQAVQPTTKEKP